jgi:hypothetical protein
VCQRFDRRPSFFISAEALLPDASFLTVCRFGCSAWSRDSETSRGRCFYLFRSYWGIHIIDPQAVLAAI